MVLPHPELSIDVFLAKLVDFYQKLEQRKSPDFVSFFGPSSYDHLNSLIKWNIATSILVDYAIRKENIENFEDFSGGIALDELKVSQTWVVKKEDFINIMKNVWKPRNNDEEDFYYHLLIDSLALFRMIGIFEASEEEEGQIYVKPTEYTVKIVEGFMRNEDVASILRRALLDAPLSHLSLDILGKLRYKCKVCKGINCGGDNALYIFEEHVDYVDCPNELKSVLLALELSKFVIKKNDGRIDVNRDVLDECPSKEDYIYRALERVQSSYRRLKEVEKLTDTILESILRNRALNYDVVKQTVFDGLAKIEKADKIDEVVRALEQAYALYRLARITQNEKDLENLKSKLEGLFSLKTEKKQKFPEYWDTLVQLCKTSDDISGFRRCCEILSQILGYNMPSIYLFLSLKTFLSLIDNIPTKIKNEDDPKSVIEIASQLADLLVKIGERYSFENEEEEDFFYHFCERRLLKLHKKFEIDELNKYHYSITHITPTIATVLGLNFHEDKSLFKKRIAPILEGELRKNVENAILIFIDGLGLKQFECFKRILDPERNTLQELGEEGVLIPVKSVFPTDTFSCLLSIFTAMEPSEHGVFGRRFYMIEKEGLIEINLGEDKNSVQKIFQQFNKRGIHTFFKICKNNGFKIGYFSQAEDKAGFAKLLLLGGVKAEFDFKPRLGELFKAAAQFVWDCVKKGEKFVLFIYIDEADSRWHDDGPYHKWVIEDINEKIRRFLDYHLPEDLPYTLLAIFSDHGLVAKGDLWELEQELNENIPKDILETSKIYTPDYRFCVIYLEPRFRKKSIELSKKLEKVLGDDFYVWGRDSERLKYKDFPDILIYPKGSQAVTYKLPKEQKSPFYLHFGLHGGGTFDEKFAILILQTIIGRKRLQRSDETHH